jgi:ABC-2 type transport system permease protein
MDVKMNDVLHLLSPRWKKFKNRGRNPERVRIRLPFIASLVGVLWVVIYAVCVRSLRYLASEEVFGSIAAIKLLSIILITFAFVLIVSNIVTTFSTFFLSEDLEIVMTGPVRPAALYASRFLETSADSSWMVLVFGLPVFAAYGTVFSSGPSFYFLSFVCLLCLLVMTTALGILVVQALVKIFPVRRLRDLFLFVGILIFVGVYLLFRMARPEDFLNPEGFASMMDYLSVMSEPSSPLLPTTWILEILRPYISGYGWGELKFNLALLVTGTILIYRLAGHYHVHAHFEGYSRAMESRGARLSRSRTVDWTARLLERHLDRPIARVVVKEFLLMARDWGRLSQLLLLIALIIVYLYNFAALPSLNTPAATMFLKNTVAFLNIALAGFVIASLGVRFLFPAISSEGRAFWILKGAPVDLRRILMVKFWFYLVPMCILALILAVVTNYLLGVDAFMFAVSTVTVLLLAVGVTSLSIGMGVFHADFKDPDPSRAFTGFGALMTMIYAGLAVAAVILLELYPLYRVVTAEFYSRPLTALDYAVMICCFSAAFAVAAFLIFVPLTRGMALIRELEI